MRKVLDDGDSERNEAGCDQRPPLQGCQPSLLRCHGLFLFKGGARFASPAIVADPKNIGPKLKNNLPAWTAARAIFQVTPGKWGLLAHLHLVRCGWMWSRHPLAHGTDTLDSTPETQVPARSYAWENKWVRCCDLRILHRGSYGKDTRQTTREAETPPTRPQAAAQAGLDRNYSPDRRRNEHAFGLRGTLFRRVGSVASLGRAARVFESANEEVKVTSLNPTLRSLWAFGSALTAIL
jgi:hypothetical protein